MAQSDPTKATKSDFAHAFEAIFQMWCAAQPSSYAGRHEAGFATACGTNVLNVRRWRKGSFQPQRDMWTTAVNGLLKAGIGKAVLEQATKLRDAWPTGEAAEPEQDVQALLLTARPQPVRAPVKMGTTPAGPPASDYSPNDSQTSTEARSRPQVRTVATENDEVSLAQLSVEIRSKFQMPAGVSEIIPIMEAVIDIGTINYDGGILYFKAITINIKNGEITSARKNGVDISFEEFRGSGPLGELRGSIASLDQIVIGTKRGTMHAPRWVIDKIADKVSNDGVRIYAIELGKMAVRYISYPPPEQVSCQFEAMVDIADIVLDFGPEPECSPAQEAKRNAFDRVLVNKKLGADGGRAIVARSTIHIEPVDEFPK